MYTILVTDDNTLNTSIRERIMQKREKKIFANHSNK